MSDDVIGALIVTTDDEKMFHCSAEPGGSAREQHWLLRDTKGKRYVGPPVRLEQTPDAVRLLVNEWWVLAKAASMRVE